MRSVKSLTSGPHLSRDGATVLPSSEHTLHVPVEIGYRRFDQLIVLYILVPVILVMEVFRPRTTDNDTAVLARDQIVILQGALADDV